MNILYTYNQKELKELITFIKIEGEELASFKYTPFGSVAHSDMTLAVVERYGKEYRVWIERTFHNTVSWSFTFTVEGLEGSHTITVTKNQYFKPVRKQLMKASLEAVAVILEKDAQAQAERSLFEGLQEGTIETVDVIETPVTTDAYCLDCGESVEAEASHCDYCGSKDLDTMEIDAEIVKTPVGEVHDGTIVLFNGYQVRWTAYMCAAVQRAKREAQKASEGVSASSEGVTSGEEALAHIKNGGALECSGRFYRYDEEVGYIYSDNGRDWKESSLTDARVVTYSQWTILKASQEELSLEEELAILEMSLNFAGETLSEYATASKEELESEEYQTAWTVHETLSLGVERLKLKIQWTALLEEYNLNDYKLNVLRESGNAYNEVLKRQEVVDKELESLEERMDSLKAEMEALKK